MYKFVYQYKKPTCNNPHYYCDYSDNPTQQGLAIEPNKMLDMTRQGIPISSMTADNMFYDGDSSSSISVPLEDMRGIDVNDCFIAERNAKSKLRKVISDDIRIFGKSSKS